MSEIRIGVLALQGAFGLHRPHIEATGAVCMEVTSSPHLDCVDGLILPGGESGTMLKLIDSLGLWEKLAETARQKPTWGICAGAILMAKQVHNPAQKSLGVLDIAIERNAYGRQLESSCATVSGYEVSYIRAPKIVTAGKGVTIFEVRDGSPSWVEQDLSQATTFHPETNLSYPSPWHRRLVRKCIENASPPIT